MVWDRLVAAGEVNAGKRALIPLIAQHNLLLNRYEWVRPSLEEIFLSLSQSEITS